MVVLNNMNMNRSKNRDIKQQETLIPALFGKREIQKSQYVTVQKKKL